MIEEKIYSVIIRLSELAGNIPHSQWEIISAAQNELRDAAEQVKNLENNVPIIDLQKGDTHGRLTN